MIRKFNFWYVLLSLVIGCIFVGNAAALRFTGDAWIAQHYLGDEATDEYYLVIKNTGIDSNSVKVKGLRLETTTEARDFFQLTGQPGSDGVTWFEINTEKSRKFKRLERKAKRKSNKRLKRGVLTNEEERQEWMDEWISNKLEKKMFKLRFRDEDGKKYRAKIGFATFENPVDYPTENNAAPVPEPATILLISTGLLGIAGYSRKKFKRS